MDTNQSAENRDNDWKAIVSNGYMGLIKGSLNRIAIFGNDVSFP